MKAWLTILPLFLTTHLALSAQPAPAPAPQAPPAATGGAVLKGDAQAQPVDAAPPAPVRKARRYPRGDLRVCLDQKDNKAIIRCANRGRP